MTIGLTHKQHELLTFIKSYMAEHNGVSPSFKEMQKACGLKSTSSVHRLISGLEERKRIYRLHSRARGIQFIEPPRSLHNFTTDELVAEVARRIGVAAALTALEDLSE